MKLKKALLNLLNKIEMCYLQEYEEMLSNVRQSEQPQNEQKSKSQVNFWCYRNRKFLFFTLQVEQTQNVFFVIYACIRKF